MELNSSLNHSHSPTQFPVQYTGTLPGLPSSLSQEAYR